MGTPTLEATEAPFRVAEGRIDALKRVALAGPDTPIGFRCWAHCQAAIDHAGEPLVIRRAHALALTLKTFPAIVGPLDVVAGTHLFGEKAGRDSGFDFVEFAPHYYDPPGDALRAARSARRRTARRLRLCRCLPFACRTAGPAPWTVSLPAVPARRRLEPAPLVGGARPAPG